MVVGLAALSALQRLGRLTRHVLIQIERWIGIRASKADLVERFLEVE
jgi:hypothetical protein